MKVFISWSGDDSKRHADALRNWLPAVLQLVKPYFTPSDVEKGTRWNTDIAKELGSSEIGILCVTRDNLHSDWVMFEAGALSKSMDKAHVCPVLFGIQNTDLAGPLKQFQTTEFEKDDFKKLVTVINNKLGDEKLPVKTLDTVFEKWWPELEAEIKKNFAELKDHDEKPIRSERELLEEVLELSRSTAQNIRRPSSLINPVAVEQLLERYIALHDDQVAGQGGYQETLDSLRSMKRSIDYLARQVRGHSLEIDKTIERLETLTFTHEQEDTSVPEDDIPF